MPDLNNIKNSLVYFSHDNCNVCKVLKPKVEELIQKEFPNIDFVYCNIKSGAEFAAIHSVFTVPTVILFLEGNEQFRKLRNFGINELKEDISRPYRICFE